MKILRIGLLATILLLGLIFYSPTICVAETNTKLLMHMDGTDNGTTFTDDTGKTVDSPSGDAHTSTDRYVFESASAHFDGTGDYVSLDDSTDWDFGNGDFTIDYWINFDVMNYSTLYGIFGQYGSTTAQQSLYMQKNGYGNIKCLGYLTDGNTFSVSFPQSAISADYWHHVALVRDGSTIYLYLDGAQEDSASVGTKSLNNSTADLLIGAYIDSSGTVKCLNGYIDEFRVVKGTAEWTSEFSPPTSEYVYNVAPTGITLNPANLNLTAGGSASQLTATVSPSNADQTVAWTSSNTSVATVSSSGLVTPVAVGTATITATTSNSLTATCAVTVSAAINNTKLLMHMDGADNGTTFTDDTGKTVDSPSGDAHTSTDRYEFESASAHFDGTGDYVSLDDSTDWDFGNGDFTIDYWINFDVMNYSTLYGIFGQYGSTTAQQSLYMQKNGSGNIKCLGYLTDGTTFTVSFPQSAISADSWHHVALVRDGSTIYLYLDGAQEDSASVGTKSLNNSTADFLIGAYIDSSGTVKCLNGYIDEFRVVKGTAEWTSEFSPPTSEYVYNAAPTGITLNPANLNLTAGGSASQLTATVSPSNANQTVTWTSSNASVATVSSSGLVTPVANGTATITATTSNNLTATCAVTVAVPVPTNITVNPTSLSLAVGGNASQLTATVLPSNANQTVTWTSSNTSVATVSSSGLVTPVAVGTATITATTSNSLTAPCTVTVAIPVTGVTLNKSTTSMAVGGTETLTATVAPTNATNKSVTWTSSKTSVATVSSSGLVTGVADGTATITVTTEDGGYTAACVVAVGLADYTYTITDNQTTITAYAGPETALTLPSVLGGHPVVAVGNPTATASFITNRTVPTSVFIPSGIKTINAYAFSNCTNLASVTIPDSVTSIGTYAFSDCTSLTGITIPNSVTSIGNGAFSGCTNLAFIKILSSTTIIYNNANVIPPTTTIYGYVGSTAQTYATTYSRTFVAYSTAEIESCKVNGATLTIDYNATLSSTPIPSVNSFSIKINSNLYTPSAISITGDKIILTLPIQTVAGDRVLTSYTPGTPCLLDLQGAMISPIVNKQTKNELGDKNQYAYTANNKLTSVTINNGETTISYEYDLNGNLLHRTKSAG